jgi:hypothetical protein
MKLGPGPQPPATSSTGVARPGSGMIGSARTGVGTSADIMPDPGLATPVELVAGGCGPGRWRGPWGHCRSTPYVGPLPGGWCFVPRLFVPPLLPPAARQATVVGRVAAVAPGPTPG